MPASDKDRSSLFKTASALALITILLAIFGLDGFLDTAKMYGLAALAVAVIFCITRSKLRLHWLRWIVLLAAAGVDILLTAPVIVDKIF